MQKRAISLVFLLLFVIVLFTSLVSASWFSNFWGKIIGKNQIQLSPRSCTDSDGDNQYVFGSVKQDSKAYYDSCKKNKLTEYYCDNNKVKKKDYNCVGNCSNGACFNDRLLIGKYCIFDYSPYSKYSNLVTWANKFFNYCNEKAPQIIQKLNSSLNNTNITLIYEVSNNIAGTVGSRISIGIDEKNQIRFPQLGMIAHEAAHVIQNYQNSGDRGWIVEGIADLVRFKITKYSDEPGWAIGCQGNENYSAGYGCAAAFFLWMEDYCKSPEIQIPLNKMMLENRDTEETLHQLCGKNLDELWIIYKSTKPPERIFTK